MNDQTSAAAKKRAAAKKPAAAQKGNAPANKADAPAANKADGGGEEVRALTGSTIAPDRGGNPDPSARAGAGSVVGKFVCKRELEGDRSYKTGDVREGKVSDLAHLARSGAIAPADKATQAAIADYAGIDAEIAKPRAASKED